MHSGHYPDGNVAAARSQPRALRVGVLLAGLLLWWALGRWVASGSERFFLVIPPVALVWTAIHPGVGAWRLRRMAVLLSVGGLLGILCTIYNLTLTAPLFPADGGWWRGLSVREVGIALYFLLALYLIVAGARRVLRPALLRFLGCLTRGQRLLPAVMAEGIFLAGFAPFLVSTFHVHRFKVPNPDRPTSLADRPFDNVEFTTDDGMVLRGWFVPADPPSTRTLLICHGMGANRTAFLPYLPVGDALHANVFLFDFRGHGDSDGHTVSFGEYEKLDVRAAINFLRTWRPGQSRQIIGLGVSMGTTGLIAAASELDVPLDAVVLDSGFAVAADLTDQLLQDVPGLLRAGITASAVPLACLDSATWLPGLRPLDRIGRMRAPVLVIHATGDRLIPVGQAHRLFQAAQGPKELWLTDTGDHGSAITSRSAYLMHVTRFVHAHCPD